MRRLLSYLFPNRWNFHPKAWQKNKSSLLSTRALHREDLRLFLVAPTDITNPKKQLYNTNYFLALGILHNKVHIWVWGRVVGSRSPHTQVGRYRLCRCVGFTTSWHLRVYWRRKHIAVTTKGISFSNKISAWAERCSVVLYWGQQTWSRPIQSGRAPELCRVPSPTLNHH